MKLINRDKIPFARILINFYLVGLIGLIVPHTSPFFVRLIPYTLLLNLVFLAFFHESGRWKQLPLLLLIAVSGFAVEVAGVTTGKIFGCYSYGQVLGIKLAQTPLIIGANWLVLCYSCYVLVDQININQFLRPPVAAALMVAFDFLLEPVAIFFGMWRWCAEKVPPQNYIAWFAVSLVFFTLLSVTRQHYKNRAAPMIFVTLFTFFLLLSIYVFIAKHFIDR